MCTLFRENASILTHLPTYPPTCLPINLLTHQPTYPPTCMPINPPTHLPAYLPTCLLTYVPAHPPTFLPTYLPSDLPTYLPTYLPIYLPACQYLAGAFSRADHHFSCKTCSRTSTGIFCISLMREQCVMF